MDRNTCYFDDIQPTPGRKSQNVEFEAVTVIQSAYMSLNTPYNVAIPLL